MNRLAKYPSFVQMGLPLLLLLSVVHAKAFQTQRVYTSKNSRIKSITVLQQSGARPRFSPDGTRIVFDRKDSDGYYNVYVSDLRGENLISVTRGKSGVGDRNNGNARFDATGQNIVFVSEEENHFGTQIKSLGDPGVGLFSNLWFADLQGHFWRLTNIPIKQRLMDRIISVATVNPLFSPDGRTLFWTERYGEGGHNKWGVWRIKAADMTFDGRPALRNERVVITPSKGNYITATAVLDREHLLVAGNLDGQHEYGMDQYAYNLRTGEYLNLTNTPEAWDEDSKVAPNGQIVWMSNVDSRLKFDFSKPWVSQPVEREYYIMDPDGRNKQRLTFFNDQQAPEYLGGRTLVAACDISPNGRYLAGTLGVDRGGSSRRADIELKVILIEFAQPLTAESGTPRL